MSRVITGKEWRNSFRGEFTMQANEIPKYGQAIWLPAKNLMYVSLWFINQVQPGEDMDELIDTLEIAVLEP